MEFVGPQRLFVVAAVDLVGDDTEGHLAIRFRDLERRIETNNLIEDAVLTLAPPDEPALVPCRPGAWSGSSTPRATASASTISGSSRRSP